MTNVHLQIAETGQADYQNPERSGHYMHLFTGGRYYPLDPRADEVDVRDIARSLATKARYGGHTEFPYSVAQHSRYTAIYSVPGFNKPIHRLERLLHDGSEAYNGDLIRPLKYDPAFRAPFLKVEEANERVIAERFSLPFPMLPHHKIADEAVTTAEVNQIVIKRADIQFDAPLHDDTKVADFMIREESWQDSEKKFLALFECLSAKLTWNCTDDYWERSTWLSHL